MSKTEQTNNVTCLVQAGGSSSRNIVQDTEQIVSQILLEDKMSYITNENTHVIDLDVVGLDVPSEIISIEQYDWLSDLISDIAFLDCNIVVFKNGIRSSWCLR